MKVQVWTGISTGMNGEIMEGEESEETEETEWEDHGASNVPITIEMTATITKVEPTPQNPNTIDLHVEGRAYPHVSSGSPFGFGGRYSTVEEAKASLQRQVQSHKEWFSDYRRPIEVKLKVVNQLEKQQDLVQFFLVQFF